MNRIVSLAVPATFGLAMVMIAQAGETPSCCKSAAKASSITAKSGCCSKSEGSATTASATESGCVIKSSIERAMKMLPQMAYKVGDKATACPMSAKSQASASGESIVYVVNGEEIGCKESAMNKLADAINADVEKLANVVAVVDDEVIHCQKTAAKVAADKHVAPRYMVAGVEFDCPKKAAWMSERVASKIKEMRSDKGCCAKSGAKATTAAARVEGCCGKGGCDGKCDKACGDKDCSGCAKCESAKAKATAEAAVVASGKDKGCCKSKAAATTASAKATGCCKSKSAAENAVVASAEEKGCCKSAAEIAAGKGCGSKGGCAKAASAVASNDQPCGSKGKTDVKVASADAGCPKARAAAAAVAVAEVDGEETPALSRAKRMIRDIVEYVVQENGRTSESS